MTAGLLAVLLALPALGAELILPRTAPPEKVETRDFAVAVPKGWAAIEEGGRAVLDGGSRDGARARVTVEFRAAPAGGDDAYLRRLVASRVTAVKGEKTGPVVGTALGGRAAKSIARDAVLMVPPNSAQGSPVALKEEHVVAPAAGGFFLAVYSVPKPLDRELRPDFERVLAGFKPKR